MCVVTTIDWGMPVLPIEPQSSVVERSAATLRRFERPAGASRSRSTPANRPLPAHHTIDRDRLRMLLGWMALGSVGWVLVGGVVWTVSSLF